MINVIIVNNEPPVLKILEAYIQKIPRLNLIAKCENVVKAFEALNAYQLDLMFLNVQMPRITGIDFLKTLANPPKVIFSCPPIGQECEFSVVRIKVDLFSYKNCVLG